MFNISVTHNGIRLSLALSRAFFQFKVLLQPSTIGELLNSLRLEVNTSFEGFSYEVHKQPLHSKSLNDKYFFISLFKCAVSLGISQQRCRCYIITKIAYLLLNRMNEMFKSNIFGIRLIFWSLLQCFHMAIYVVWKWYCEVYQLSIARDAHDRRVIVRSNDLSCSISRKIAVLAHVSIYLLQGKSKSWKCTEWS